MMKWLINLLERIYENISISKPKNIVTDVVTILSIWLFVNGVQWIEVW